MLPTHADTGPGKERCPNWLKRWHMLYLTHWTVALLPAFHLEVPGNCGLTYLVHDLQKRPLQA